MDNIILKIPSEKKYFSTVRLTLASISNSIGMDIENIEDLKVSVSEVMNMLVEKTDFFEINMDVCSVEEKVELTISTKCCVEKVLKDEENKFAVLILQSLVDKVEFRENSIFLVKNKG